MSQSMWAFLLGALCGGVMGFIGAALCGAARRTDDDLEARTRDMERFLEDVKHD
jgi:hypothetical protein